MNIIRTGSIYQLDTDFEHRHPQIVQSSEYALPSVSSVDDSSVSLEQALPSDIDIFSGLSKETLSIEPIRSFLRVLWGAIRRQSRQDITLSKLNDTLLEDESVLIEWIFVTFRVSFQFYKDGSSIYCLSFNDLSTNDYSSVCRSFRKDEYEKVSDEVVEFVYKHM